MLSYLPRVAAVKKRGDDSEGLDPDIAWWIGYAYRFLCRKKGLTSRDLVGALPPKLRAGLYGPYHTFTNDEYLTERLYEDYLAHKPVPSGSGWKTEPNKD